MDLIAKRIHPILKDRAAQIKTNLTAVEGGQAYIDARLHRHAAESDTSWDGVQNNPLPVKGVVGRKQRAYVPNYSRRVVNKIMQYVFGQDIARKELPPEFLNDADRAGTPLTDLMAGVSMLVDAAGWCWIQVDRDPLPLGPEGQPVPRSIAQREANRDRVYWRVWSPLDVVDWSFDSAGRLSWLITTGETFDNSNPMQEPTREIVRTLYTPTGGTRFYIDPDKPEKVARTEDFTHTARAVPFVLVGTPRTSGIVFDDIERIQCALLNLGSSHHDNLYNAVYPQLVLPADLPSQLSSATGSTQREALQMVRGLNCPLLEAGESKGLTRYLTPAAGDLETIPNEMDRLRRELFDLVGMMLQKDTKAAESAESKAWDRLDPQAVLSQRSAMLQSAEEKAVALSRNLDSTFPDYKPAYPRSFDIGDVKADFESLLTLDQLSMPESARREIMRAGVRVLNRMNRIAPERLTVIESDIERHEFADPMGTLDAIAGGDASATAVADTAMNGAQVAALVQIATEAAQKGLPVESAKQIASAAFPGIDDATLERIFKPLASFKPAPVETPARF